MNEFDKRLMTLCNSYFKRSSSIYIDLTEKISQGLLLKDKWRLDEVFSDRIVQRKSLSKEERMISFRKFNGLFSDEEYFPELFVTKVRKLYDDYLNKTHESIEVKNNFEYKNCSLSYAEDDGMECLKPNSNFDVFNYYTNLLINENLKYSFNSKITTATNSTDINIATVELEILSEAGQSFLPIYYCGVCHKRDLYGHICGNEIKVGHHQLSSSVKCNIYTQNLEDKHAHSVNVSHLEEIKKLYYMYVVKMTHTNNESVERLLYTTEKIESNFIVANCLNASFGETGKNSNHLVALAFVVKEHKDDVLKERILLKDKKSKNYLEDIFRSIVKYYKKNKKLEINNKNKYLAYVLINVLINNMYNNYVQNAMILGNSGSGKSFYCSVIAPLFTNKVGYYNGMSISRVGFIGGQDYIENTKIFRYGAVSKDRISIVEEAARPLDLYHSENENRGFNIYESIKVLNPDKAIDVGIQGSKPVEWKSSLIFLGNMEGLTVTNDYKKQVRKEYKKLSDGKKFDSKIPLFCSLAYYKSFDETLSKAHKIVRDEYLHQQNYITRLPQAEQSRFDFMVYLIPDNKDIEHVLPNNSNKTDVHREIFIKELNEIFDTKSEVPVVVKNDVFTFLNSEIKNEFNNYDLKNTTQQFFNRVFFNCVYYVLNNRKYWGKDLTDNLNEDEKELLRSWLTYNYNSLLDSDASMITRPMYNDSRYVEDSTEDLIELRNEKVKEYYKEQNKLEFEDGNVFSGNYDGGI